MVTSSADMSTPAHTYGPTCLLADKDEDPEAIRSSPSPPRIRAQFFYTSSLPIDDPLAALPDTSPGSSTTIEKFTPQPFSERDNIALEKAWKELRDTKGTTLSKNSRPPENSPAKATRIPGRFSRPNSRVGTPNKVGGQDGRRARTDDTILPSPMERESVPASSVVETAPEGTTGIAKDVEDEETREQYRSAREENITGNGSGGIDDQRKRDCSPIGGRYKSAKRKSTSSPGGEATPELESGILQGSVSSDTNISGSPFIRAPLRRPDLQSTSPFDASSYGTTQSLRPSSSRCVRAEEIADSDAAVPRSSASRTESTQLAESPDRLLDKLEKDVPQALIPVGHSRLHLVELPNLKVYTSLLSSLVLDQKV